MKIKILLIEDKIEEAEIIMEELNRAIEISSREEAFENVEFEVEYLRGSEPQQELEEEIYQFYEQNVLSTINEKIRIEQEGAHENRVGILLDLMLTKEDYDRRRDTYYPPIEVAKEIYYKLKDNVALFIITAIEDFGTQSNRIIGEDCSNIYAYKSSLVKYKLTSTSQRILAFYRDFYVE